jgi:hypothetical protein
MGNKPALIVQDFGGEHSKDLNHVRAQIMRGGSWKKQRIVVILPAADMIPAKVALSHWNLAFPPNNGVVRILAQGMEVGDAYSQAIEGILSHPELSQWEYILTIESDNTPPSDGVIKLLERMEQHEELSCIGGLYFCKGVGGINAPHIWGNPNDPTGLNFRPQPPDANGGLVECCGTSMGFNLWRIKMFKDKRIKRPLFRTLNGGNGQGIGTQDLAFWSEARKYGYRCGVDCSIRVGHLDFSGAYGPEGVVW